MKSYSGFRISGLPIDSFRLLFNLSEVELASHGARRCIADAKPGFPCRVSLEDAEIGESVVLTPYVHHDVDNPYRSSGPIYVREKVREPRLKINEVPAVVRNRILSVRAYDSEGLLVASDVVDGNDLENRVPDFFVNQTVAYLHVHNAKPGCYSCRVDRA